MITRNFKVNEHAKKVIEVLLNNGAEAYLVGGCVRDIAMGKKPKDWDITTNAMPIHVIDIFNRAGYKVIPTGLKHGTVTVSLNDEFFEVTTYRVDGEYSDGRHPDTVRFTPSLKEDLSRRDFRINAMAYNPVTNEFVDYFDGLQDIESQVIRCVGDPLLRFEEDSLRMLRAIRFACQLNFSIDYKTATGIKRYSKNIKNVSAERIRDELFKAIVANPRKALTLLRNVGLLTWTIPEFEATYKFKQDHPYHPYTLWEHTIMAMEHDILKYRLDLLITMLLHDIGKLVTRVYGDDGVAHYHGHPNVSVQMAREILNRLKVSNEFKDKVLLLISEHDTKIDGKQSVKKMLYKIGKDNIKDLFKIQLADAYAHSLECYKARKIKIEENIKHLEQILKDSECFKLSDMAINGKDLMEIGFKQGKDLGNVLRTLFSIVLEHPELNTRETLLSKAMELKGEGKHD